MIIAVLLLLASLAPTFAKEDEGKLIDRLLRPNLSRTNAAQDKQFFTQRARSPKQISDKRFHVSHSFVTRSFNPVSVLSPNEFSQRHFRIGESKSAGESGLQSVHPNTLDMPGTASISRVAPENDQRIAAPSFAGLRPFDGQGKSQKALHAYDRPLTIEEVRELLNKNK